jgi:MFS family permease
LWISFVMLTFIGTLANNFNVTLPLFVTRSLHGNTQIFTILYSVYSFGAVVCALIVAHRKLVGIRHIIIGACALGFAMILVAFVSHVTPGMIVVFLLGMASILYINATTALTQVESRQEMQGRVIALQSVLMIGTTLIGGPFSGWLADDFGSRSPFIVGGIVCLMAAIFGYWATRIHIPKAIEKEKVLKESLATPVEG